MATSLEKINYLKALEATTISSVGVNLVINGVQTPDWFNIVLAGNLRQTLRATATEIRTAETASAKAELDSLITASQAETQRLKALKAGL